MGNSKSGLLGKLSPVSSTASRDHAEAPLVVRNRPFRDNLAGTILAGFLIVGTDCGVYLYPRFQSARCTAERPDHRAAGRSAGAVVYYRLGTGAQVTVTDTQIIREISRPDFVRTTYNITQVDGGILASHVDYGRFRAVGAELILFVSDGRFLWIADGISRADVRQIAGALSSQGLMECLTPIGSTALTRVMGTINRERNRG